MSTGTLVVGDKFGNAATLAVEVNGGVISPHSVMEIGGAPIGAANPVPFLGAPGTPAGGTTSTVVTGGTAVVAITGPVRGGYITNPASDAAQGVTAERLYLDPVSATPGSTDAGANGTCRALDPGETWNLPVGIPVGVTVHVNAATSGHKFTVVTW